MKNLVIAVALMMSSAAMACPGSNLMTFQFKGKDAFVLNMQDGRMTRVESNKDIALINLNVNGTEICREVIHGRALCSEILLYFTIFGTKSIEAPLYNQTIPVEVTMTDGRSIKTVTSKQFPGLARGMGGCGPIVNAK